MASAGVVFDIIHSLDDFVCEIPKLQFGKDNLKVWATEVFRALEKLGISNGVA